MRHGFSLVELSIVLVILGLLTGGILTGQSLIRAAEIRSVTTEFQRYQTAMMSFRDKYFALPGDMRNAQSFWGIAASCPGTYTTPSSDATTCNGTGDGLISWNETWRAWQHLAAAGLVEGTYTGVPGTSDNTYGLAGTNMPKSKLSGNVGWVLNGKGNVSGSVWAFDGNYGNVWLLGWAGGVDTGVDLKAEEVWNIDTKVDDGKPGLGMVRVHKNSSRPNCASTDNAATAVYLVQNTGGGCNLLVISGY
tara:strand:+ start:720 stop:1466 length:747 start_codon:yes stop_codon:yes gene_type:complete